MVNIEHVTNDLGKRVAMVEHNRKNGIHEKTVTAIDGQGKPIFSVRERKVARGTFISSRGSNGYTTEHFES